MAISKIKKNDLVIFLAGKDKGRSGKVLRVVNKRVWVEGLNLVKKHVKPNPQQGVQGGILEREASAHLSNLAIVDPKTGKASRVGIKVLEDGKRVRYYKSNGEVIDSDV